MKEEARWRRTFQDIYLQIQLAKRKDGNGEPSDSAVAAGRSEGNRRTETQAHPPTLTLAPVVMSTTIRLSDGEALMKLFGSGSGGIENGAMFVYDPGLRLMVAKNGAEKLRGRMQKMVVNVCDR